MIFSRLAYRRERRAFKCVDCRADTLARGEYYMVDRRVWEATGLGAHDGMLCVACLEARLGRRLTARDFVDCEFNRIAFLGSPVLADRMRGLYPRLREVS